MCGNGAGIYLMKTTTVPRRALSALHAVVVGTTVRFTALFLTVTTAARDAATTAMVSVLCVLVSKLVLWGKFV